MNKTIWIVVAVLIVLAGVYYLATRNSTPVDNGVYSSTTPSDNTSGDTTNKSEEQSRQEQASNPEAKGRVIFSVTDAAASMSDISEISLKISKVELHRAIDGWTTVSTTPHTFSLLALNAGKQSELLADAQVKVGPYDQVRVTVDSVTLKTTKGTKVAKLPANQVTIATVLPVVEKTPSSVNIDFIAKPSLYVTTLGDYIFAPVVHMQTQSYVTLTIDKNNFVIMNSGRVNNNANVGMDIDGTMKNTFQIDVNKKYEIGADGKIKIDTSITH